MIEPYLISDQSFGDSCKNDCDFNIYKICVPKQLDLFHITINFIVQTLQLGCRLFDIFIRCSLRYRLPLMSFQLPIYYIFFPIYEVVSYLLVYRYLQPIESSKCLWKEHLNLCAVSAKTWTAGGIVVSALGDITADNIEQEARDTSV